jgi:hypothetical protein
MPFVDLNTDVKPWLGIDVATTTHDAVLTLMRDSVESAVLTYTEAKFTPTAVTNEILDSNGSDTVVPRNWPIVSVQALKFNVAPNGTGGSTIEAIGYQVLQNSIILQHIQQPRGRSLIRVDYTHGYASLPADVKEAILLSIEAKFRRKGRKAIGISSRSKKDESESMTSGADGWNSAIGLPKEAVAMLEQYRTNFEFAVQPMATRNP